MREVRTALAALQPSQRRVPSCLTEYSSQAFMLPGGLAPDRRDLQDLYATSLPAHLRRWLLVSNRRLLPQPNDGVVPLASERQPAAQDDAEHLYLIRENHTGILRSARSRELIDRAFGSLPSQGCRP